MEAREARHRHAAQILSMAKRPFSTWTLILEPDLNSPLHSVYSQCRKSCRKVNSLFNARFLVGKDLIDFRGAFACAL